MFFNIFNQIAVLSIDAVRHKFPEEFVDKEKKIVVFGLVEMIADELKAKHFELFVEDEIKDFVSAKYYADKYAERIS